MCLGWTLGFSVLLALGGTDAMIRLFLSLDGHEFRPACTLRGHENWIRGLDFLVISETKLLLASASQDRQAHSLHMLHILSLNCVLVCTDLFVFGE